MGVEEWAICRRGRLRESRCGVMCLTQQQPLLPPIKEERLLPTSSVHYTQEGWFPRICYAGNRVPANGQNGQPIPCEESPVYPTNGAKRKLLHRTKQDFRESGMAETGFPRMSPPGSSVNSRSLLQSAREARPGDMGHQAG
jgi:hypothetical protein